MLKNIHTTYSNEYIYKKSSVVEKCPLLKVGIIIETNSSIDYNVPIKTLI